MRILAASIFAFSTAALAQTPPTAFPADGEFSAVSGGSPSTFADPAGDTQKSEIDVVGGDTPLLPAIQLVTKNGFLFLRMRLNGDPCQTRDASGNCTKMKAFGWVFAFDGDSSFDAFENIIEVNGNGGQALNWERNTVVTSLNDPNEKAEVLIKQLSPVPSWIQVTNANSTFGGDADFFLTMALDCADFESEPQLNFGQGPRAVPAGQTAGTPMPHYSCGGPIRLWAGTNTNKQNISSDLSFAGNTAQGSLGGAVSPPILPDPTVDTDGDGIPDGIEDANHDGLVDNGETDPFNPDSDGDGLCDGSGTVAGVCVAGEDVNDNGIVDVGETDPRNPDTDGDLFCDGANAVNGKCAAADPAPLDPCIPNPNALACPTGDFDGDGSPNGVDPAPTNPCIPNANALTCPTGDTDGDGVLNGAPGCSPNTTTCDAAPQDPCIPLANALACPTGDTDGDGFQNGTAGCTQSSSTDTTCDPAPTNPCVPNANALACPTGDTDGDGFLNGTAGCVQSSPADTTCDPQPTNPCFPNPNALACPTGDTDGDGDLNGTSGCAPNATTCDPAPLDPCNPDPNALACPTGDTDGDGDLNGTSGCTPNATTCDVAPLDPCRPDPTSPACLNPCANPNAVTCPTGDTDGDGFSNGTAGCTQSSPADTSCDPAPQDPCIPDPASAACIAQQCGANPNSLGCPTGDTDGDGVLNGLPGCTPTSSTDTTCDPAPQDPCNPNPQSAACIAFTCTNTPDALACPTGDTDGDGVLNGTPGCTPNTTTCDADPNDPCVPDLSSAACLAENCTIDPNALDCPTGDPDGDGVPNGAPGCTADTSTCDGAPNDPCDPNPASSACIAAICARDANDPACPTGDADGDGVLNGAAGCTPNTTTCDIAPTDPCQPDPTSTACITKTCAADANALGCPTGDTDGDGFQNGLPGCTQSSATDTTCDPAPSDPCNPNPDSAACIAQTCAATPNALVCTNGDFDGDGVPNGTDADPSDPCNPDPTSPTCTLCTTDPNNIDCPTGDTDGDGVPNATDPDPNDPCNPHPDSPACPTGDTDGDGVPNGSDPDPNDACNPNPDAVTCPTGDTDGDGVSNSQDTDPTDPCNPDPTSPACHQGGEGEGEGEGSAGHCVADNECASGQSCTNGVCKAPLDGLAAMGGGCYCGSSDPKDEAAAVAFLAFIALVPRARRRRVESRS